MITEDVSFYLWEVKCDGCGAIRIFYKESDDVENIVDVYNELMAENWVLEIGGACYCPVCSGEYD